MLMTTTCITLLPSSQPLSYLSYLVTGTCNTEEFWSLLKPMVSISTTPGSRRDTHQITHSFDCESTQINILYCKRFNSKLHYLVVCDFSAYIPGVKKRKFSPTFEPANSGTQLLPPGENDDYCSLSCHRCWRPTLILQVVLTQIGHWWRALCWMLPPRNHQRLI